MHVFCIFDDAPVGRWAAGTFAFYGRFSGESKALMVKKLK
jgi:hypothetical protein